MRMSSLWMTLESQIKYLNTWKVKYEWNSDKQSSPNF